jgi:hypothetical protein
MTVWYEIKTLDGRSLARTHSIPLWNKWPWVEDVVAADAECGPDDVGIVETEDGDIITVLGNHYARVATSSSGDASHS